jgi:hypothetical protein
MPHPDVTVDLRPLKRAMHGAEQLATVGGRPRVLRAVVLLWAERYKSFAQERFIRSSRGGGDWSPLSTATLARRRKGKGRRRVAILIDTGQLFGGLNPQVVAPGSIEQEIPWGVRVGYGGPERHPEGAATIADIARFHQTGAGRLPKREIIVEPPSKLRAQMAKDLERALARMADGRKSRSR